MSFVVLAFVLLGLGYAFFRLSPWPSALRVRRAFDRDGIRVNEGLARHVPPGVMRLQDEQYDLSDDHARLDVYFPESVRAERGLPTIVWVHGGGWIAGNKDQIENYARILAAHSYTVITVNYALAPGKKYPTPVRQLARALAHVQTHAARLRVDASRLFLAGDSAGAQIAAQMAHLWGAPDYAAALDVLPPKARSSLLGTLLFCGRYDAKRAPFGALVTTMLWSYSGTKNYGSDPRFATFSIVDFVTRDFPPTFITSGNGDSLTPHSVALAEALRRADVPVETLFFPSDHSPALPHEFQFNLDSDAGQLALAQALSFLARCLARDAANRGETGTSS